MCDKILLQYDSVSMLCRLKIPADQKSQRITTLDCPVNNCHSYNLKKLSNHLIQVHRITNKAKRKKLLQKAKRVSTKGTINAVIFQKRRREQQNDQHLHCSISDVSKASFHSLSLHAVFIIGMPITTDE